MFAERFIPLISRYFDTFAKVQQARDATERGAVMGLIPQLSTWRTALTLENPPIVEPAELASIFPA